MFSGYMSRLSDFIDEIYGISVRTLKSDIALSEEHIKDYETRIEELRHHSDDKSKSELEQKCYLRDLEATDLYVSKKKLEKIRAFYEDFEERFK